MKLIVRPTRLLHTVACLMLLCFAQALVSQTTWDGSESTQWFDPGNWSAGVPTPTSEAYIPGGMPHQPNIDAAGALAQYVNVQNGAVLTIASDGTLTINGASSFGMLNQGTVHNNGSIVIGSVSGIGNIGIQNDGGTFHNNAGGEIQIDRSSNTGLYNISGGTFTNAASITIGGIASVGNYGIVNGATFYNQTGGDIQIDRSTDAGLYNPFGSFDNTGRIAIGATASVGTYGIYNAAAFNNNACGEIAVFARVYNFLTFTNAGLLVVSTAELHSNSALTNNGILVYPQGNPIPNVTNNDLVVSPISGGLFISNALGKGGALSFTADGTWYRDEALSIAAGFYNQAGNVFTALADLPQCTDNILYFSITDDVTGCSRTVPIRVNYDATPPNITCPASTILLANNACSGTVGTWSAVSVSDACAPSANITVSQSPTASTVIGGHNTTQLVTLTANDGNGNTQTCQFSLTLQDQIKPGISCPPNKIIAANINCTGTVGQHTAQNVSDNCSTSVGVSQSPSALTLLSGHGASQIVTLTADDGNGNTQTCQFSVSLQDQRKPSLVCPSAKTIQAGADCTAMLGAWSPSSVSDNCTDNPSVVQSPVAGTLLSGHNDARTVTLTATDDVGNTRSCSFKVTLRDKARPNLVCPADKIIYAGTNCLAEIGSHSPATLSDNCSPNPTLEQIPHPSTELNGDGSSQIVTLTASDAVGNFSACTFNVTLHCMTNLGQNPAAVHRAQSSLHTDGLTVFVSPNPSTGVFLATVQNNRGIDTSVEYVLRDALGREVLRQTGAARQSFDLKDYTPGLYLLEMRCGTTRVLSKVLVQR